MADRKKTPKTLRKEGADQIRSRTKKSIRYYYFFLDVKYYVHRHIYTDNFLTNYPFYSVWIFFRRLPTHRNNNNNGSSDLRFHIIREREMRRYSKINAFHRVMAIMTGWFYEHKYVHKIVDYFRFDFSRLTVYLHIYINIVYRV